jgi:SAM-dependent methyltransferase
MDASDNKFAGSIPEFYDTYMVPLVFEPYAADLATRVAARTPNMVLETAAGSGVVTRALSAHLSKESRYHVTDLNQPMLDHAANRQQGDARISWQQADALALPFDDAGFDVAVCQFGAMFFPDRIRGYAEAHRVLKSGGAFIFNIWDRIEDNIFADLVTNVASKAFPDDPPIFLRRTPHGHFQTDIIEAELGQAGYAGVSIEQVEKVSAAPDARFVALAYCQGTPLRNEIEARDPTSLDHITDLATAEIESQYGTGPVAAKIQALVITAEKP